MEQLSLLSRLEPPVGPNLAFDDATIEAVVALMAEAITAVFEQGGGRADDESEP